MKILILEDEFLIGEDLKDHLEDLGHTVVGPTMTCSAALEALWQERPDLAILDTQLGGETCEVMLDECKRQEVPVIICSGHAPNEMPAFVQGLPHLWKPYFRDGIISALASGKSTSASGTGTSNSSL